MGSRSHSGDMKRPEVWAKKENPRGEKNVNA